MAYDRENNPLRNVRVELPEYCPDKGHWGNLIIWGLCQRCGHTLGEVSRDTKVFAKLAQLRSEA